MPYTYTKLATPTTIRLIQVMPDKIDDTIACIIHTYDTQLWQEGQNTHYRALSYRWGNSKYTRSVYLKDAVGSEWHRHPVHENLWRFVDYAWVQCLYEDRFWTDYFCLDQSSDEEKSQQIPRMGVIYAEATDVIIWLGLSEIEENHLECFLGWPKDNGGYVELPRDEACQPIVDTVKALWKNEYWRRAWIVQEVTLARSAMVLTQSLSIGLGDLCKAIGNAKPAYYEWDYPSIRELHNLTIMNVKDRQMWNLLRDNVSSEYQCQEPNDRLYAFLGLLHTQNDFIIVDYKRSYNHVILDAVLESLADCPPVWFPRILDSFYDGKMPLGLITNANELEEYLHQEKTLPRHKELARLALHAFDAMSLIMTTKGSPQSRWAISNAHEALSCASAHCMPKMAIFMGFTLAHGPSKGWASTLLNNWKACRLPRLQKQSWRSPWLCEAHRVEDHMQEYIRRSDKRPSIEEYMQEYLQQNIRNYHDKPSLKIYMREYERVYNLWHNDMRPLDQYMHIHGRWGKAKWRTVPETRETSGVPENFWDYGVGEACRHAGEHCDGSSMVCEIPQAFFRLTISTGARFEFLDRNT